MLVSLDVALPNPLSDLEIEVVVRNGINHPHDEAFLREGIDRLRQLLQRLQVELAAVQDRDGLDVEDFLEVVDGVIPREGDVVLVPDREAVEVGVEVVVANRVTSVDVLTADAPAVRDQVVDAAPEGLDPVTRRVVPRVQRTSMDVIHVHRRVLTIHLLGDNDFLAGKARKRQNPTIVVLQPRAERQMWSARIFFVNSFHGHLNKTVS